MENRVINSSDTRLNSSDLRSAALFPKTMFGQFLTLLSPVIDRVIGVHKLRRLYIKNQFAGLDKQAFSAKLLAVLGVEVKGIESVITKLPKTGRCIVVCNHPYGMVEGVIIASLLSSFRADTKVMANVGLKIFKELRDYFIFANPLNPKSAMNISALKQSYRHIENGGLLVVFPAGRVSFFQKKKQRITDGDWNRLATALAYKTNTPILPIHISGTNSKLFHNMGRIYYRFRLLMLIREMFKLQNHTIALSANNLLQPNLLNAFDNVEKMNDYARVQCYLNDARYLKPWPKDTPTETFKTILAESDKADIKAELSVLPANQLLLNFKQYSVYYGYQKQLPTCVQEIARLREITFRELNEGSGEPLDTDSFDATYMHLFVYDDQHEEIIGAYRIGQTDILQSKNDQSQLYLSQMFKFSPRFINQQQPCLEMGRSFIVSKHQNSFYGLLLLWKGIGAYVCQNPRYRTLYGTVSLSKLYDPRSVAVINETLITKTESVVAQSPFFSSLHPDVSDYLANNELELNQVSALIKGIEADGKDIPVLLKQYHKLGAEFHCIGIDNNFNQTPGLLLSVHLPRAPEKLLKLYLGKGKDAYVNNA